ncbi:MAG TPA: ABC transporter permease [Bryobacteraceae bacterium]|jgi:putative ABC transport system permease protein|nr:ABC transporter permease [Bryobacteraceae bacterium]
MKQWQIALRALLRRPGYSLTAIAMLILGIGATTTLFSVVDTILLRPLPYLNPDRLVTLLEASPSKNKKESLIAPGRLEDWNRLNQTFETIGGSYTENVTDTSGAEPERLAGRRVSPRFFAVYGAPPLIGRTFTKEEEVNGGPPAAVISYGVWTRRYGQNLSVLNQRLVLAGKAYPIVGVMPKEFAAPSVDLWIPAQIAPFLMRLREARFFSGIGRMKPGVTMQQAQADLARVQQQLGEQYPQTDKGWSAVTQDLKEQRVGDYRRTLLLVFGAVALLLLIAVANISGLTLAQLHQREREMAIRSSVGASRGQVIGTVMREVFLIAAAGAACGALISMLLVNVMAKTFTDLPRMSELAFNWRALLFAVAASLAATVVFGAIPALQSTRTDLAPLLAESSRSISGGRRRLQRGLVVAQLAFTVLLLASAGLLLRSYYNLSHVDYGFDTGNAVTFHVGAAWDENRPRIGRMQLNILSELERFPGVEAAGMTNFLPATGATLNYQIVLEGLAQTEEKGTYTVGERTVTAGYLQALKIPLLAGDWCPAPEPIKLDKPTPAKALVNRRFVELYGKGQNIVGRHYRFAQNGVMESPDEIVGVIGDAREDGLAASASPYIYTCQPAGAWPDPEYVVRTKGDPRALLQQIRHIVHGIEPNRAVFGVKLLDTVVDEALEQPRLNTRFVAMFAAAAMLLASVGLYSLISLIVTARTREIGVRIALGASRAQIMRLIFTGAVQLLAAGIVAGLALTLGAERLIKSVLFGVSPLDAETLAAAVAVLAAVSMLAAYLPAKRAASIDPLEAMRIE